MTKLQYNKIHIKLKNKIKKLEEEVKQLRQSLRDHRINDHSREDYYV